jgi:glycosyltransferase involved in cell wall biosynthesis
MKILQMHKSLGTGGIEAMVCGLSNALAQTQDVTVCTIVQPSPDDKFYRELDPAIRRETIGRTGEGKPFKEMLRIARFIRKGHFDIVQLHGFFYYFVLAILLCHRKTCFCYTVHSNALKENNPWDLRILSFKRFCFRKGWVHPITISPASQQSFTELYGCGSRMIPNGVIRPRVAEGSSLDEYRMTPGTRVFLHASRISPEKNQLVLCQAFDSLIREGADVVLVIAGPIHHHDIFDQMKVLFSDRIHYIGTRSDIPSLLCTADGMCLASFYEGLPVILLEAMAAGCIPVCTPVGGILDVVRDGENGILASGTSEEEYVMAMKRYLALPDTARKEMQSACLRTGEQYDIQATGQKYLSYYTELLAPAGKGCRI